MIVLIGRSVKRQAGLRTHQFTGQCPQRADFL